MKLTKEILKEKIKQKFGTQTNFAIQANIDRYEQLQKPLAVPNPDQKVLRYILNMVQNTKPNNVERKEFLTPRQKVTMRNRMLKNYGSVYAFCHRHPQYLKAHVYSILNHQKRISSKCREIMDILEVE